MKKLTEAEKESLYKEVYPIAKEFRKSFIDEDEVIEDTFKMIEQLGFLLIRFPALSDNTLLGGFTIHKSPFDCIYINSRQNLGRQYMSCWHECYHAYTHEGNGLSYLNADKKDPIEYKAELFAGLVLMPDNLIIKYVQTNNISLGYLSHEDIIRMQNYFKVGYSAMLTRLLQVYPEHKKTLGNRYFIAKEGQEQRLIEKTVSVHGDLQLISATNDCYIPESFLKDIEYNFHEKRISKEKAYELLMFIDRVKNGI